MANQRERQEAALRGSQRVTTGGSAQGAPKIGVEEFLSFCDRFGLSRRAMDEIRAVLEREDWGEGPFLANYYSGLPESRVQAFERTARETFGTPYATGVNSGTGALHAAMVGCGAGPGAEIICPAIGFVATAAAAAFTGAKPVFCDVDTSLHMDPAAFESLITPNTLAVVPTCVMGGVYDAGRIPDIAESRGIHVIEDCAQSCGATFRGRYLGTFGAFGCFSISAYKIVGAGEGGLLLARDERQWARASQLIECGGLWRPDRFAPPRYEGELFPGTNYRMSELEAALDVVQLRRMPETVRRFRAAKRRIVEQLEPFREVTPQRSNDPDGEVGYTLRFFPESVELAEDIAARLAKVGMEAATRGRDAAPDWHVYHDMYPVLEQSGARRGDCPVADSLFERMVSVDINQWFTESDCQAVADALNNALDDLCTRDSAAVPWR